MISKAYMAHRGVTARGPRGGVYHRGGTVGGYRGGAYRGGVRRLSRRRGLSRRIWRLGAAQLVSLGCGGRDCGRRCDRRLGHGRGHRLRGPAASAGTVLVLYRSELPAGFLGRLPVENSRSTDPFNARWPPVRYPSERAANFLRDASLARTRFSAMDREHNLHSAGMAERLIEL